MRLRLRSRSTHLDHAPRVELDAPLARQLERTCMTSLARFVSALAGRTQPHHSLNTKSITGCLDPDGDIPVEHPARSMVNVATVNPITNLQFIEPLV